MKQNVFVRQHSERWEVFESYLSLQQRELPVDFPKQFRQVCNDLAIARTRHYSPSLIEKLNSFVRFGQNHLYQSEKIHHE